MPLSSHSIRDHMDPEPGYRDPVNLPLPDDHHAKLGRFLLLCAEMEGGAHRVALRLAAADETLARILIGQPRFEDLLTLIEKLATFHRLPTHKIERFKAMRTHLRYIYAFRNIVAHQSPSWREGWVRYDRIWTARDISNRESLLYVASLEEVENLNEFTKLLFWSLAIVDLPDSFEAQSKAHFDAALALLGTHPLPPAPPR